MEAFVDSDVNVNNLQRLARSLKLRFASEVEGDCYRVTLERDKSESLNAEQEASHVALAPERSSKLVAEQSVGTVVFLAKDKFGEGDADFSRNLIDLFLQTLYQGGHRPRAIVMANTGVKLLDPQASTAKVLADFLQDGVEVLACGLCVEYYGLKGKIPTEQITNMFAICEYMMAADKVIQP